MKGLVFVIAVALACCVTTCGALKCRACIGVDTREACLQKSLTNCNASQDVCMITYERKLFGVEWRSACSTKGVCDTGKAKNDGLCVAAAGFGPCVYCCNTDGCVGAASAVRVSIVTMATAALAVLLKNAAGF